LGQNGSTCNSGADAAFRAPGLCAAVTAIMLTAMQIAINLTMLTSMPMSS
jgi:hypothetical protein